MREFSAQHILSLSNNGAFNTQHIMDFVIKILGYGIDLRNSENPYEVYFMMEEKLIIRAYLMTIGKIAATIIVIARGIFAIYLALVSK